MPLLTASLPVQTLGVIIVPMSHRPHTRGIGARRRPGHLATAGWVLLIVLTVSSSAAVAHAQPGSSALRSGEPLALPFPRLALWWPDPSTQPLADLARYDMLALGDRHSPRIPGLRTLNPDIILLDSTNACELAYDPAAGPNAPINERLAAVPAEWLLTQVGSRLAAPVSATGTALRVAAVDAVVNGKTIRLFVPGESIVIDGEVAHITKVDPVSRTLTIVRGRLRPSTAHSSGTRVASLITSWFGTVVLDLSESCPSALAADSQAPETWAQYNARTGARSALAADWDGLLVDRSDGDESWLISRWSTARTIDPSRTNAANPDYAAFDRSWNAGLRAYETLLRGLLGPDALLLGNLAYPNLDLLNGNTFEGFPAETTGPPATDWRKMTLGPALGRSGYLDWSARARQPNVTMVQTYEVEQSAPTPSGGSSFVNPVLKPGFVPAYRRMRFGLTTALMGDGLFSYEVGSAGHGALGLLWFDEYDAGGAGGGYLGSAKGPAYLPEATPSGPSAIVGGGFDRVSDLASWELWNGIGYASVASIDTSQAPVGTGSLRVVVTASRGADWRTALTQRPVALRAGAPYTITFWARADRPRSISVGCQRQASPWNQWATFGPVALTTAWRRYELPATSSGTDPVAGLQFGLGETAGTVWLDDVRFVSGSREVYRRDFAGGTALVNPSLQTRTVRVGTGYRRMYGTQDPFANDGLPAASVTLGPHDGAVLVTDDGSTPPFVSLVGPTRYETAIRVSTATFPEGSCDSVVLATGAAFPDALSAAGLAGAVDGPVLLVSGSAPSAQVLAEMARVTRGRTNVRIYIVGGTGAVSYGIEAALRRLYGTTAVSRAAGADRYSTASAVAAATRAALLAEGATPADTAFVVGGAGFSDALLVGPIAYAQHMPVILAGANPSAVVAAVRRSGATDVRIIGAAAAVSPACEYALATALGSEHVSRPCSEDDRYRQAVAVAEWAEADAGFSWGTVAIATGATFPDALTASALQGRDRGVLLLTPPTTLDPGVAAALAQHAAVIRYVRFIGGPGAVATAVRVSVRDALR
jgi:putative cell wall-binding protein